MAAFRISRFTPAATGLTYPTIGLQLLMPGWPTKTPSTALGFDRAVNRTLNSPFFPTLNWNTSWPPVSMRSENVVFELFASGPTPPHAAQATATRAVAANRETVERKALGRLDMLFIC